MKLKVYFLMLIILSFSMATFGQKIKLNGEGYKPETGTSKDTPASLPFYDSFEDGNYSEYDDLGGTYVTEVTNTTSAVGSYSLHIDGGSWGTGVRRSLEASKPYYISFYVMSPLSISPSDAAGYFEIGESNYSIFFSVKSTGPSIYNGSNTYTYGSHSPGKWYFIEFKNIDYDNQTFDFYVEGSLIATNISFHNAADNFTYFILHNFNYLEAYWDAINIEVDNTAPVPDVDPLPDITSECEINSLTAPTATDNIAGTISGTHDATLPITSSTTITWTYDDGYGNTTTQTQDVVINDPTAPVPDTDPLPDVTAECEVASLTAPTATDNCAGTVTGTHDATLPIATQGTTTVTWTYDDGHGNTTTQTQDVVINDATAPVPDTDPLSDVTAECEVASLTAPTATDNCAGTVTATHDATLPITTQGTTTVTWTYEDGNGNTSTQTQDVVINDATAPVPDTDPLSDVTAECEVTTLTAPTATDNCTGTVTATHDATLPINAQGTTTVTWTYEDDNGNTSTQTQDVVIDDITNPSLTVQDISVDLDESGNASINAADVVTQATDNCELSDTTLSKSEFTTDDIGDDTIEVTVNDISGNSTTQSAVVTVNPGATDVNDISDANVEIYPNPTNGNIHLRLHDQKADQVVVMDLTGKTVIQKTDLEERNTINLSEIPDGVYLIRVYMGEEIINKKVIKK